MSGTPSRHATTAFLVVGFAILGVVVPRVAPSGHAQIVNPAVTLLANLVGFWDFEIVGADGASIARGTRRIDPGADARLVTFHEEFDDRDVEVWGAITYQPQSDSFLEIGIPSRGDSEVWIGRSEEPGQVRFRRREDASVPDELVLRVHDRDHHSVTVVNADTGAVRWRAEFRRR